ncbi:MAG: NADH-quinone oxidoreductase subunit L [Acidobacteria bacterium]|nr:NADH-quinone oxidoreductase subunit L [Acidobacteriota bacterium]
MKLAWLIPILPLLGCAFSGLLGRRLGKLATAVVSVGVVFAAFLVALATFFAMKAAPGQRLDLLYGTWMAVGTPGTPGALSVPFGLVVDPLSGTMMLVVTGIGALIHLYSVGYMWEEEGFARYFSYLNLFVFFMLTLVLGSSLPLLFVGWEGVGLCSYLLIGYYFETDYAPDAGLKAFLTNRVGDLGMAVGMMALFAHFGTLTVGDILAQAGHLSPETSFGILGFATLMLFVGATGKSAQIPLYVWLPDAMAGPTPVSALIHAATMVTAGIFLLCRMAPLFLLSPVTMNVVAWTGAATALFAATIGLVQRDIKKVLAYSTVSQLGYMFLGLGAAGFAAGFFHVFTHAWFKALLFLGAGSVIHALHHEQDLFRMGGLKDKLPITFWTMLIATLAIMGLPPFSGFFSKDEILYLAFLKSPWLWAIGVVGACCTAFYMWRLMALTFWGEPRDHHAFEHAHESPWQMTLPLGILALGSALGGFLGVPEAFGGHFAIGKFLEPALTFGQTHGAHGGHHAGPAVLLAVISTGLGLAAALAGFFLYKDGLARAEALAARVPGLHLVLLNKYFVDEAIEGYLLRPFRWFGNLLWKLGDVILIDGVGVNLPGALTRVAGDFVSLLQTGRVRNYALGMGFGILALAWIFLK